MTDERPVTRDELRAANRGAPHRRHVLIDGASFYVQGKVTEETILGCRAIVAAAKEKMRDLPVRPPHRFVEPEVRDIHPPQPDRCAECGLLRRAFPHRVPPEPVE